MPPKNHKPTQIFYKSEDGQYIPLLESSVTTLESEECPVRYCEEYFKDMELSFEMTGELFTDLAKLFKPYFHNNWRKIHHLSHISRRGKRK